MSDGLENFIRNNRAELDIDEPSANVWNGIENEIPSQKKQRLFSSLAVAASVLVLVVAAYFMGMNNSQRSLHKDAFASEADFQEFQEAQDYYTTTIGHKMKEVKKLGVGSDVLNDLEQLDEVYNELKEEMLSTEYENKEFLINLMINNYETKIEILEKIIDKKNRNEGINNNNETISI